MPQGNLLKVAILGHRKEIQSVLRDVQAAILAEIVEMEKTSGRGRWPAALGRRNGASRRPLQGISKHVKFLIQGNSLYMRGKKTGKRGRLSFLFAHHQTSSTQNLDILPQRSEVLYLPLTKAAEAVTAKEAYRRSSRFGGPLKEGTIIGQELFYYDAHTVGEKKRDRLVHGFPDFLWMPRVRLPKRPLFNRTKIRGIVRDAVVASFKVHRPEVAKHRIRYRTSVY